MQATCKRMDLLWTLVPILGGVEFMTIPAFRRDADCNNLKSWISRKEMRQWGLWDLDVVALRFSRDDNLEKKERASSRQQIGRGGEGGLGDEIVMTRLHTSLLIGEAAWTNSYPIIPYCTPCSVCYGVRSRVLGTESLANIKGCEVK